MKIEETHSDLHVLLTKIVNRGLVDVYEPPDYDHSRLGASSSGKCFRQVIKTFVGDPIEPDIKLKKIFGKGAMMHKLYHDALVAGCEKMNGKIISINPFHMDCFPEHWTGDPRTGGTPLRIGGTPDEILFINNELYVIDWKTANERSFHFKKKSPEASLQNKLQVATYMNAVRDVWDEEIFGDCPAINGLVCYVNKSDDDLEWKDVITPADIDLAYNYWEKIKFYYRDFVKDSVFPPVAPCEKWECTYCPHYKNINECKKAFAKEIEAPKKEE